MRLAEALMLRADYQKRFEQVKQRIVGNAKVQEGDAPAEDPQDLVAEMERIAADLLVLVQRINRTNCLTAYGDGRSLSDALATRDMLAARRGVYGDLAKAASVVQARTSRSEVKFKSTVRVPEVQKQVDALSKLYRETDARVQELNWSTDLVEEG